MTASAVLRPKQSKAHRGRLRLIIKRVAGACASLSGQLSEMCRSLQGSRPQDLHFCERPVSLVGLRVAATSNARQAGSTRSVDGVVPKALQAAWDQQWAARSLGPMVTDQRARAYSLLPRCSLEPRFNPVLHSAQVLHLAQCRPTCTLSSRLITSMPLHTRPKMVCLPSSPVGRKGG